jgi:two-component system response regulator FixJ
VLLDALELGFAALKRLGDSRERAKDAAVRLQVLTPRERDVLNGLAEGLPNKTIAYDLGISPRTVEIHRANLMSKLEVRSLSEALRLAFAVQQQDMNTKDKGPESNPSGPARAQPEPPQG